MDDAKSPRLDVKNSMREQKMNRTCRLYRREFILRLYSMNKRIDFQVIYTVILDKTVCIFSHSMFRFILDTHCPSWEYTFYLSSHFFKNIDVNLFLVFLCNASWQKKREKNHHFMKSYKRKRWSIYLCDRKQ